MKKSATLMIFLLVLVACGGSNSQDSASENQSPDKKSMGVSCIAASASEPCALISPDEIASLSGTSLSDLETKPPHKMLKNPKYMACSFFWPSDRTQKIEILSVSTEVPKENSITVGMIDIISQEVLDRYDQTIEEYFTIRHTTPTEEDKAKLKEALDEKMTEDGNTEAEKQVGSSLMGMASNFTFQPVSGIGDLASYELTKMSTEGRLHLLHKNVIFTVGVDISDDPDINLEMAKKIAGAVLAKCD